MIDVNGFRVRQAREISKLTQTELADRIGVNQYFVARLEADGRTVERSLIERIAFATGFPVGFFQKGIPPEFPTGSLLFRCRSNLEAAELKRLRQLASIESEIVEHLSARTTRIDLRMPMLTGLSPKEVAQITRATLGVSPDTPIPHLVNRLERNGILIFAVPNASEKFDAFSLWSDTEPRTPVIIVNTNKPADRVRFSCAHELGHLILHKSPRGNPTNLEKEASEFAGEFLMPEEAIRREIHSPVTLTELAKLKPRWGVAIQALVFRSRELGLLTDRQYRYLFEQISKRKWRKREPENLDIPAEKPRRFRKLVEMHFGIPIDVDRLAAAFDISPSLAADLVSIHAEFGDVPKKEKREDVLELLNEKEEERRDNVVKFRRQ